MTIRTRDLYRSQNGDRWCLARDSETGRVFIRHEANLSSGGQVTDLEVGVFLTMGGQGPEKQELMFLLGN